VYDDLQNIAFVLKFGKDGVCSTPVGETKINHIDAVSHDGNTVCRYENPFRHALVHFVKPEPERDNLHEQIYRVCVCQSGNVKLKASFQQINQMAERHISVITLIRKEEKNPARIINRQHQCEIAEKNSRGFRFYSSVS
jgi:hypothetical protein